MACTKFQEQRHNFLFTGTLLADTCIKWNANSLWLSRKWTVNFLQKFRETGFTSARTAAIEIASAMTKTKFKERSAKREGKKYEIQIHLSKIWDWVLHCHRGSRYQGTIWTSEWVCRAFQFSVWSQEIQRNERRLVNALYETAHWIFSQSQQCEH
jgi:hypothetical protein